MEHSFPQNSPLRKRKLSYQFHFFLGWGALTLELEKALSGEAELKCFRQEVISGLRLQMSQGDGGKELRASTTVGKSSWRLLDYKCSVPFLVPWSMVSTLWMPTAPGSRSVQMGTFSCFFCILQGVCVLPYQVQGYIELRFAPWASHPCFQVFYYVFPVGWCPIDSSNPSCPEIKLPPSPQTCSLFTGMWMALLLT